MIATLRTEAEYAFIFAEECEKTYPAVDALEARLGHAVSRSQLESAARVLACPFKEHDPSWQHGRVLYAVALDYLQRAGSPVTFLDIGTAKGFSALCLQWALNESAALGAVVSVDVLDPLARVRRNTVAEVHGERTLVEILAPWPESKAIHFLKSTGIEWLTRHPARVHVAFVDGKHTGAIVALEGRLLAERQQAGDVVIFDDVHLPDVASAVSSLSAYTFEYVSVLPTRAYAIGVRL